MGQPYVGEIRMFAGNFPPNGWMFCSGQLLPISENDVLFNLIGTTYGGDGQSTFALPNLQSRLPVHVGTLGGDTYALGQSGGTETVTLTTAQIPSHNHLLQATATGTVLSPANAIMATPSSAIGGLQTYVPGPLNTPVGLHPSTISVSGGSNQPHDNVQPFLCVNFIISMFGIFPSQT